MVTRRCVTLRRKARRALSMPLRSWLETGRAGLWLAGVRLGLRWLPFRRLCGWLEIGLGAEERPLEPRRAAELARAVDVAARNSWPWPPARCLARALVLTRLLRKEGYPATMRIGVRRPTGPDVAGNSGAESLEAVPSDAASGMSVSGTLSAHAWVECAGSVIGDPPDVAARYAVLRPGDAVRVAKAGTVDDEIACGSGIRAVAQRRRSA